MRFDVLGQIFFAQKFVAANSAGKVLAEGLVDGFHVASQAVLRGQMLVAFLTIIILLSVAVDHDLMAAIVGDRRKVFIAFVAPVQDASVFVDGQLLVVFVVVVVVVGGVEGSVVVVVNVARGRCRGVGGWGGEVDRDE